MTKNKRTLVGFAPGLALVAGGVGYPNRRCSTRGCLHAQTRQQG